MADIETKQISELIAAQDIGDSDLFIIEQGGAAKKALGSVVKVAIGGSSLPSGGTPGQVLTKTSSGAEWSDAGTPTQSQTDSAVADWLDAHPEATTTVQDGSITEQKLDPILTAKVNGGGISNDVKVALLALLEKVAYVDEDGQTYLDALEDALYPPANLSSITAVFDPGETVIYDTNTLEDLKQYLTVTANMSDGTTQTVTNYTLSGTLTEGTSTITVSYGGKADTFDVDVVEDFVIRLHNEDFRITATGAPSNTYSYPYYYDNIASSPKRYSYVAFDLRLDGGKKYRFVATTNYSTAGMGCQFYNQTALNAVNSQSSFSSLNIYDPGWQPLTTEIDVPAAQNGSPIVGVRFTFRQDANSSNISSDFAVSLLTVKEVVE